MDGSDGGSSGRRSKVERVIDEYDLDDLGDTLVTYWTRTEDRYSLRELATYFNREVLRAAMEDAGMHPLEGEVENTYELVHGDDASSGARRQAERSLEREGIEVDDLTRSFVSHQAIHTYLREHRNVSQKPERTPEERREKARETVERLRSRTEAVAADTVERFAAADALSGEGFDVVVDIRVIDRGTGEAHDLDDLLEDDVPGDVDVEEDAGLAETDGGE
jgi:hypothetical protein